MTDFNSWALNGPTDAPDTTELDTGFICDRAPRDLFNWLVNAQSVGFGNRFMSVEAIQNTPPVSPSNGETWVVGIVPTGVWVGKANQVATWLKDDWTFTTPKPQQLIGLPDGTNWRWDQVGGAWVEWVASETVRGPVRFATQAEADGGTVGLAVQPQVLKDGVREVIMTMTAGQSVPSGVMTTPLITYDNFGAVDSIGASVAQLTIGTRDAGIWLISGYVQYTGTGPNKSLRLHKNGLASGYGGNSRLAISQNGNAYSNDTYAVATAVRLAAGDVITVDVLHAIGSTQTLGLGRAQFIRLGP